MYKTTFNLIAETPDNLPEGGVISRFAASLEDNILQSPELWLWTHRRWKLAEQQKEAVTSNINTAELVEA